MTRNLSSFLVFSMGCNASLSSDGVGVDVDPGNDVRQAARDAQGAVRQVEQVIAINDMHETLTWAISVVHKLIWF